MNNKVVLLVEDNPDDEELTRLAFEECRLANKLVIVRDGQEALDYLFATGQYIDRDINETPQVILLDLKLPKVDGLDVLRIVRNDARTKLLPVVVLTSSREEQDLVNSYSLGASSYIQKPVDYSQFVEAVRQLGLYWLVLNQTADALQK
ncbi:MAG: response regulator [Gallionellaceae bacterium]|jgi:two-component system response regulator